MGRRSLPKTASAVDVSDHLLTFDDLPRPWCAEKLYGRKAPLEVEVGSGKGLFLANAAVRHPDHDFLGIEIARKYARFAAARVARARLDNARVLCSQAERFFGECLEDGSLAAVHVYFPDPWWKARHKKRRVLTPAFLRHVERTLKSGGRFHFWTDVREYFESALEIIAGETTLGEPLDVPAREPEHDLDYRTHFERRVRLAGEPVYRAEFVRS